MRLPSTRICAPVCGAAAMPALFVGAMNRGYAFGFLIVLVIVLLGLYVAFTGFRAARDAQLAQASAEPTQRPDQATRVPTRASLTPSATLQQLSTPLPAATEPLAPAPTEAGAPAEPAAPPENTATPEPTVTLPPTATPQPAFEFRVLASRPDPSRGGCCYIFGTVRDAGGNMMEGIRVQLSNQWNAPVVATTKGGTDLGKYDFPIGTDKVAWYVSVVDANGNRISTEAVIQFDVGVAGQYMVDWQRTY